MVDSVSNIVLQTSLLNDIKRTKHDLATLQKHLSSGRVVDTYLDLTKTGRVEGAINLESKINDLDSYITNNNIVMGRVEASDIALKTIIDNLTEYRAVIVKRRSAIGTQSEVKATVKELGKTVLGIIRDSLNTRYEGQYLFSGGRIDNEAVGDIVNQSNYLNYEPTSNYYKGDAIVRTTRASDSLLVSYGVKADDISFQKAIASIHIAMNAENDDEVMNAFEMITESISGIINIRNMVRNSMTQLAQTTDIQESIKTYFSTTFSDLMSTNIEEASIKLSNDMVILTASYQAFAKVSSLNLTDFLK